MSRNRILHLGIGLLLALFLWTVSGASPAAAAPDATCTSNGTGNWGTTGTWTGCGGLVPQTGDTVIIAVGHTVTVNVNTNNISSLTVNGTLTVGATVTVSGDLTVSGTVNVGNSGTARTITVGGNITINSGGALQVANVTATHTLNAGGDLTNNGTFNARLDGNSLMNVTFNNNANQTVSGTGTTNNFNLITINNSGAANNNIVEVSSTNFAPGTDFLTLTDGILKLSGSYTLSNDFFSAAGYTVNADEGLWLNNPNVTVNAQGSDVTLNGLIRITAGTYNIGNASNVDLRYNTGAILTLEGGALNIASKFTGDNTANDTITFTMSGGTLTVNQNGNSTSSNGSFDISVAGSSFTMSGGTIILQQENTGGTPLDYRNIAGTVSISGGTVQFGTNTSPASETYAVGITSGTTNLPSVVLNQTTPPTVTLGRPANISGSLTINSGSTFNANSQALNINGNWTNNGTFTSGAQTTTFNGTSAQTISGSSVTGFSTWVVNSGATVIIPDTNIPTAAVAVTNNGTLQQTRTVNNANVQFLTISTDRYRGVDIDTTGSAANLGAVTVSVRGNSGLTCPNAGGVAPVYAFRCFDITPTNQGAAIVTLWVLDSERNGIAPASLTPYRFSGSWNQLTNVVPGSGSNNYYSAQGDTTGFSTFLLGDPNFSPTAITLSQAGVVSGMSGLWVVLVGLLLLVSAGWWVKRVNS